MASVPQGKDQYLARFSDQSIACSPYALAKLGIDRTSCSIKIEDYVILCIPYQLGFKRSIFMASLSAQELIFFQKYVNQMVGLSITFNPDKKPQPLKFFLRCSLLTIGQMKGRDNAGLFVMEMKTNPEAMINIMGAYFESQELIKVQYEDYANNIIHMTPDTAKLMGYNLFATISSSGQEAKRIQIFTISSKNIHHLEAAGAPLRAVGTSVTYHLFFRKYRVTTTGTINEAVTLPQGLIRTQASLALSPELVEIIDEYWYHKNNMNWRDG